MRNKPFAARDFACATLFKIQAILLAEKYASAIRPVRFFIFKTVFRSNLSISAAVRLHCQQILLYIGSPVLAFQATTLSRWFVIETADMFSGLIFALISACSIAANSGYELASVKVTMGGVDVTSSSYNSSRDSAISVIVIIISSAATGIFLAVF